MITLASTILFYGQLGFFVNTKIASFVFILCFTWSWKWGIYILIFIEKFLVWKGYFFLHWILQLEKQNERFIYNQNVVKKINWLMSCWLCNISRCNTHRSRHLLWRCTEYYLWVIGIYPSWTEPQYCCYQNVWNYQTKWFSHHSRKAANVCFLNSLYFCSWYLGYCSKNRCICRMY